MQENIFHFGKHKGKPLSQVPEHYLEWVLFNSVDDRAVEAAEQELHRRGTALLSGKVAKQKKF